MFCYLLYIYYEEQGPLELFVAKSNTESVNRVILRNVISSFFLGETADIRT